MKHVKNISHDTEPSNNIYPKTRQIAVYKVEDKLICLGSLITKNGESEDEINLEVKMADKRRIAMSVQNHWQNIRQMFLSSNN